MERIVKPEEAFGEKLAELALADQRKNKALAESLCEKLIPARSFCLEPNEVSLLNAVMAGLRRWNGHVATFGYTGVRKRRATICIDMDEIEQPTEK